MSWTAALRGPGDKIAWKNQTGGSVNVGAVVAVGNLFGILIAGATTEATTLANLATGQVALSGMYELPKLTTDTFVEGARLYWDSTNTRVTTTPIINAEIGSAGEIGTNGQTRVDVRLNEYAPSLPQYGTNVASAAAIVPTGRVFTVTGTTNITSITSTGMVAGTVITLIFSGILTFTDGNNLKLAGDLVTSADDTITLAFDGTNFFEVARSVN